MAQTKIKAGLFEGIIGNGTDGYFLMSNGDGTMTWSSIVINPTIASIAYPGSVTAADPAGGETITVTGTGFKTGATVTIGGTAAPAVSYVSETQITFTTPAKAAGDYDIVVTNTDTGSATYINGISYNGIPTWTTAAGSLGTFASDTTISTITLQATEPDAGTITFSITNGALPTGLSLTGANIDGTTTLETADTLYTFTVTATDDESQATPRTFTITVTKQFIGTENFTINTYTGNGSTQSIEGKIGTAADFNGSSSYIDTGYKIGTNSSYSISLWAKTSRSNYRQSMFGVLDTAGNAASAQVGLLFSAANMFEFWIADGTAGWNDYTSIDATAYQDGNWHHYVLVINGTSVKLYADGNTTPIADLTSTISAGTASPNNLIIGRFGNYPGAQTGSNLLYFDGNIDQFRIFNKALSSSEVTTLYGENNASLTKSTTDIFDDGSGVALYEFEKGAIDTGGTNGKIGSAGVFNGSSSRIDKTSVSGFPTGNNSRSISLWVYNQNTVTAGIIGYGNSSTGQSFYLYLDAQGELGVYGYLYNYDSNYTLPTNQWIHLVITHDGTTTRVYANGTEQFNLARTFNTGTNSFRIGGVHWNNSGEFFNGKIDQVRIFNKALSSSEVTTLYGETSASATKSTTDIFDDSSGVALYELEGNANDTGGVSGKFGSAAIFNGNGYIAFDGLPTSSNMSVSFWMKIPSAITTYQMILELSNGYAINVPGIVNGKIYAQYANTNSAHVASNSAFPVGEWVHVVGTFTSSSANLYINNASQSGGTIADYLTADQNTIGSRRNDGFFTGSIDDVRIYSDILTTTEIGYLYNNDTANIPTSNLVAYYKLDGNSTDEQGSYDGVDTNVSYAYNGTATNVSYAYDGTPTNVSFVGTSFQPDFVWIKRRSSAQENGLYDSVRGATKQLYSDLTNAEVTATTSLTSFDSNGFSIGSSGIVNNSGQTHVAWMWKAGGTAVSNTDGTITSTVSANQDAGFSIATFTTPTNNNFSIGHGLNLAPELVFLKSRSGGSSWTTYAQPIGATKYLFLNSTAAATTSALPFNDTPPTDSVINLGSATVWYGTSADWVAYCFHSVDGYQKIGSYTGTGSSGNTITTGFKPRFLMIKNSTGAYEWVIVDSTRGGDRELNPNSSAAENGTGDPANISFTSTGFVINNAEGATNQNNATIVYLAIA